MIQERRSDLGILQGLMLGIFIIQWGVLWVYFEGLIATSTKPYSNVNWSNELWALWPVGITNLVIWLSLWACKYRIIQRIFAVPRRIFKSPSDSKVYSFLQTLSILLPDLTEEFATYLWERHIPWARGDTQLSVTVRTYVALDQWRLVAEGLLALVLDVITAPIRTIYRLLYKLLIEFILPLINLIRSLLS